ncbi:hypothetical protein [Flagellimonas sp. S3867]|uniref:hypothetical protein n=1 Tax=Flagellimonas sp. S3867 TaxID=2768063 RepID=UPI001CC26893|nr:hypothetical protein [Flagellimonas sp. S3867]
MKYILIISIICLASCKAQKETKMNAGHTSDFELVASDAYSGIDSYEAAVISNAKSLNKFYSRINKTRKPGLPVPVVDFSKDVLVVMCLGEQKGETTPKLAKSDHEDGIVITVALSEPNDSNIKENPIISYPFYIYKLPTTSKAISIQKQGF